jgi:hypothetical protein
MTSTYYAGALKFAKSATTNAISTKTIIAKNALLPARPASKRAGPNGESVI